MHTIALVGRPNVGKSRLFNRLAGRRVAIVHDQPGVTRDVNAVEIPREGYTLLDTGGLGLGAGADQATLKQLISAAEEQVWFAMETADLVLFVVDGREGLQPMDETIAQRLRRSGRKVRLVVNKVDRPDDDVPSDAFARLGFDCVSTVSAEHGYGEIELRQEIRTDLGLDQPDALAAAEEAAAQATPERIAIAFVGRPNVGKSSLCNRLLDSERLVVSEVAGTTRDAIALDLDYTGKDNSVWPFRLVDTAGIRRRTRVDTPVEVFSAMRSREAIAAADIVFLVVDAVEGVSQQEKAIAGEISDTGRCCAIVVNKWDLALEGQKGSTQPIEEFREEYAERIRGDLFFLPGCPVLFVSAKTGYALDRILKTARRLREVSGRKLPTPRVNRLMEKLLEARAPRFIEGKRLKIYYTVQIQNRPFEFRAFCNRAGNLEDNYRRYLEKAFVEAFDLGGCPVRFELRGKERRYGDKEER